MPTTLYLRAIEAPPAPPSAGSKSVAMPGAIVLGANNATGGQESLSLSLTKGPAQTSVAHDSDATVSERLNYMGRWSSGYLAAQTIATNDWIIAPALNSISNAAVSFTAISIYVWRPTTSSVVGFIYDSNANAGLQWGASESGRLATLAGSQVITEEGDVLVLEFWRRATQSMANDIRNSVEVDDLRIDGLKVVRPTRRVTCRSSRP